MTGKSESLGHYFSSDGPFADVIDGFEQRDVQIELAQAIEAAIEANESIIAEAGTGTGKTFAYLIPAILQDKKTIISTGTKNLQEQLFFKDLPLLLKALSLPLKTAMLKGRANYLCRHRIELNQTHAQFETKTVLNDFRYIVDHLPRFDSGDISDISHIPESAQVWSYVTSQTDTCLGKECDYYDDCFLVKARKKALGAKLVVINHHLFFADSILKEDGFSDILPKAELVIFDEAHQLAKVASHFFGNRLSTRQLKQLARDSDKEQQLIAKDDSDLSEAADTLKETLDLARSTLGDNIIKQPLFELLQNKDFSASLDKVATELEVLKERLDNAKERSLGLKNVFERAQECVLTLKSLTTHQDKNSVYWLETYKQSFVIHETPVSVVKAFQNILNPVTSYVYTSATFSVDGDFQYFKDSLGLSDIRCDIFDSPFDYENQSILYMPRGMRNPASHDYLDLALEAVIPIIKAFKGRTFLLFTSFSALNKAADLLEDKLDYPLLVQGAMAKTALIDEFREKGNAVLLGTSSFWEGVDVKGKALSCVIIDKLPFESPGDPVVKARLHALGKQGLSPFHHYQLPLAVIALKQGLGRLIRATEDYGVMVVCDPRLGGRDYGKVFFKSLPKLYKSRDKDVVLEFIDNIS